MRITKKTADILVSLARKHFGATVPVRLFGSRLNDSARGGDIDIHVVAQNAKFEQEIAFLVDVEKYLDERVDIRVQSAEPLLIDKVALANGVLLGVNNA